MSLSAQVAVWYTVYPVPARQLAAHTSGNDRHPPMIFAVPTRHPLGGSCCGLGVVGMMMCGITTRVV